MVGHTLFDGLRAMGLEEHVIVQGLARLEAQGAYDATDGLRPLGRQDASAADVQAARFAAYVPAPYQQPAIVYNHPCVFLSPWRCEERRDGLLCHRCSFE